MLGPQLELKLTERKQVQRTPGSALEYYQARKAGACARPGQ